MSEANPCTKEVIEALLFDARRIKDNDRYDPLVQSWAMRFERVVATLHQAEEDNRRLRDFLRPIRAPLTEPFPELGVAIKAQPLTQEDRQKLWEYAMDGIAFVDAVKQQEAALRQGEAALAEVTRERNDLRTIVDWYYPPSSLVRAAKGDLRKLSPARRLVVKAIRSLLAQEGKT